VRRLGFIALCASAVVAATVAGGLYGYSNGYFDRYLLDPAVRACDLTVRSEMKAPWSYQRVDAFVDPTNQQHVRLEYKAQNGFGALQLGTADCGYTLKPSDVAREPGSFELGSLQIDGGDVTGVALVLASHAAGLAGIWVDEDKTQLRAK
jgi:hypothetical protein